MMEYFGLGGFIIEFFINVVNKDIFLVMIFFSFVLINFVVLFGGGYWVIQGFFVIFVVQVLGVDFGKLVMVIVYGE